MAGIRKRAAPGLVLAPEDQSLPAGKLAQARGWDIAPIQEHQFPDGESRITLPAAPASHILVYCSLDRPDRRLLPLLLALQGLRAAGVAWLGLVAPYLCYMRQDKAFNPGEVISQRVIGSLLSDPIDAIVTVDPHLHRVASLSEVFPSIDARTLTAAPLFADWIAAHAETALLIGPDAESRQWVEAIAGHCGSPSAVAEKIRRGDRSVEVRLPEVSLQGRHCVLVDDVASTGHTLLEAVRGLRERGAGPIDILVTHALFVGSAEQQLREAGAARIVSTDAILHPTNALSLAPLLAEALRDLTALR
jgi:ribose-phosphate pyrophosphokinase